MRRLTIVVILGVFVGLIGPPAMAKKYTHFNAPAAIHEGDNFAVRVFGCEDGETWQAFVVVNVWPTLGGEIAGKRRRAQDNLLGRTRLWISDAHFLTPEPYRLVVKCIHRFNDGNRGVFFREEHELLVKP